MGRAAKALVRSGDAGVDQGAINRAQAAVQTEIDVNRVEQSTNLSMDDTDVLELSADKVIQQARTSASREAGALVAVMSNELDSVEPSDADQRDRIAAIQQKLVRSFSKIAPDESPLSPGISTARKQREQFDRQIAARQLDFGGASPVAAPEPPPRPSPVRSTDASVSAPEVSTARTPRSQSPPPSESPAARLGYFGFPPFSLPGWAA